jgi:hypothetical protein
LGLQAGSIVKFPSAREGVLRLCLLGAACAFTLGLAEAALRFGAHHILRTGEYITLGEVLNPEDPLLGYSPIPNSTRIIARGGIAVNRERINSAGLRDVEHAPRRDPGTMRLLILGDSFMYGDGVDLEETMPRRLSDLMPDVEVINTGVRGYDLGQEYLYYKHRGRLYEPDLVLFAFFVNDLAPDSAIEAVDGMDGLPVRYQRRAESPERAEERARGGLGGFVSSWLRSHSSLYKLIRVRLDTIRVREKARASTPVEASRIIPYVDAFRVRPEGGPIPAEWERAYRILNALKMEVEGSGARLVVVMIPAPWQLTEDGWDRWVEWQRVDRPSLSRLGPQEMVTAWCERSGTACLDLMEVFQEGDRQRLYFAHDSHWSPQGHALGARAVEAFLSANRWP